LSLGSSLDDIIAKDHDKKSREMEVSVRPKPKEIRQEIERFKAVMHHPEFKANPLKVIRLHVENTWEKKEGMS
jgi:Ribosome biogenesis protein SLX9